MENRLKEKMATKTNMRTKETKYGFLNDKGDRNAFIEVLANEIRWNLADNGVNFLDFKSMDKFEKTLQKIIKQTIEDFSL